MLLAVIVLLLVCSRFPEYQSQIEGLFCIVPAALWRCYGLFSRAGLLPFYLFFEFSAPAGCTSSIGLWGGPRREYAALKFFIYILGSLLILIVMIGLYLSVIDPLVNTLCAVGLIGPDDAVHPDMIPQIQQWLFDGKIAPEQLIRHLPVHLSRRSGQLHSRLDPEQCVRIFHRQHPPCVCWRSGSCLLVLP